VVGSAFAESQRFAAGLSAIRLEKHVDAGLDRGFNVLAAGRVDHPEIGRFTAPLVRRSRFTLFFGWARPRSLETDEALQRVEPEWRAEQRGECRDDPTYDR
jgi:hypothetical protein